MWTIFRCLPSETLNFFHYDAILVLDSMLTLFVRRLQDLTPVLPALKDLKAKVPLNSLRKASSSPLTSSGEDPSLRLTHHTDTPHLVSRTVAFLLLEAHMVSQVLVDLLQVMACSTVLLPRAGSRLLDRAFLPAPLAHSLSSQ